jgi:hypothetical protein
MDRYYNRILNISKKVLLKNRAFFKGLKLWSIIFSNTYAKKRICFETAALETDFLVQNSS